MLRAKTLRGTFNLDKLRTGVYRGAVQKAEEIDLWLYRAPSGEVSLAEAFGTTPQPVAGNLGLQVPLVDLTAVACVNRESLEVRVVVPTKVSKVFITAEASSVSGGLGLAGLKIASKIEEELEVKTGPVKVRRDVDCCGRRVVKIDADGKIIEE